MTITNYIKLRDGMSPALERISRTSDSLARKFGRMSGSVQKVGSSFSDASRKAGLFKNILVGNILANFATRAIDDIGRAATGLVGLSDELSGVDARLAMIGGSQQNAIALNEMIYQTAQRARGEYMGMAKAVADLSINAKDAFPDPTETVRFVEGLQKLFVIGGTSKQNQSFAMLQLQQALASGRLQGDEFRSITENAPILQDMIAKTMNVPRGQLRDLASESLITADVIKKAIFDNFDEIDEKFAKMPQKWGDRFMNLKNFAMRQLKPITNAIADMANSEEARQLFMDLRGLIKSLVPVLYGVVKGAQVVIRALVKGFSIAREHAGFVNVALAIMAGYLAFNGTMALISAGKFIMAGAAMLFKAAADWVEVAAIIALTLAQEGLNAALYACPLTWIIGAVIALIAVFYGAVAVVNHFAGTSISATGLILGAFMVLFATIWNLIAFTWNMFLSFAEFIGNLFVDPLSAVYNLFADIWNGVVELIGGAVAQAIRIISTLPGLGDLKGTTVSKIDRKEISGGFDYSKYRMNMLDYGNEAQWGYNVGDSLGDFSLGDALAPAFNKAGIGDEAQKGIDDTAKNTGKMSKAMESTEEDLKFLRDAAEREWVNKFTTATVKVDVGGLKVLDDGHRSFDGMLRQLNDVIIESVTNGAEAVQK